MDAGTVCLLAIIVIAAVFVLPRLMGQQGRRVDFSRPGSERPRVDDENISSRGGIGAPPGGSGSPIARGGDERPRHDDRDIDSRGGFGRDRPTEERDRERHDYGRREEERGSSGGGFSGHIGGARPSESRDRDEPKGGGNLGSIVDQMRRNDDDDQPRASSRNRDDDEPRRSSRDRDDDDSRRPSRERDDSPRPTNDDPDVESRGGFGRDKG